MVRSASLDIAINAPVLPPESAALACPSFTALIAMPIEVVRARRIAWLGFSLGFVDSGEWAIFDMAAPGSLCCSICSFVRSLVAVKGE